MTSRVTRRLGQFGALWHGMLMFSAHLRSRWRTSVYANPPWQEGGRALWAPVAEPRIVFAREPTRRTGSEARPRAMRVSRLVARGMVRVLELAALLYALVVVFQLAVGAWTLSNGDITEYHKYALAFWVQSPQFTKLPIEYPPLAVLPFGLTLLPDAPDHLVSFGCWMGAFCVLGYFGFLLFSTHRKALAYMTYILVGALGTVLLRFDVVPALLTLAALWALKRQHFYLAYVLVALDVLIKLYPAVLVPVIVLAQWRAESAFAPSDSSVDLASGGVNLRDRRSRGQLTGRVARVGGGVALCVGIVVFLFWGAAHISPSGSLSGIEYLSSRPVQVESVTATLLWLGSYVGFPARPAFSFNSYNLVSPLSNTVVPAMQIVFLASAAFVGIRQVTGKLSSERAFLAMVCLAVITGKVFSPQYLIWILPLVAEVEGFSVLWLLVAVFTTLDYPVLYHAFLSSMAVRNIEYPFVFSLTIAVRNLLLLVAAIGVLHLRLPVWATVEKWQATWFARARLQRRTEAFLTRTRERWFPSG